MICRVLFPIVVVLALPSGSLRAADAGIDFFENKIRPVLVEHCYSCHSHQSKMTKAGLALDSAAGWKTGGDSGSPIVPGKPAESLLIKAIKHGDENLKMPPKGKLPDAAIADFEKWISIGAPDPRERPANAAMTVEQAKKWWAFQPINPSSVVRGLLPGQNPIDAAIVSKLTDKKLTMNPPADARTLVRRIYLDLWGLPPKPNEVADFLQAVEQDRSIAISLLIDKLMASPHFGERWGRHWLDVARFGESSGYEHDNDRPHAWHFRDFVIRAFQNDLPFDKFVQWQIAGDELAPSEAQAWHATGFLAAGLMNGQVTEREAVKERYETFDDWIGTAGTAFLGLTVGCARCHDHKFDAISANDYYRLAANFTSAVRVNLNVPRDPATFRRELALHKRKVEELQEECLRYEQSKALRPAEDWRAKSPEPPAPPWLILTAEEYRQGKTKRGLSTEHDLTRQKDGSYLFTRLNGDVGPIVFSSRSKLEKIQYLRLEALPDESLPNFGPGFGNSGEFRVNVAMTITPRVPDGKPKNIKLEKVSTTTGEKLGGAAWGVDRSHASQFQAVVFKLAEPIGFANGAELKITLSCPGDSPSARQTIGRFRLSVACIDSDPDIHGPELAHDDYLDGVRELAGPTVTPNILKLYCLTDSEWKQLDAAVQSEMRKWRPTGYDVTFGVTESPTPYRMMIQGPDVYEQSHILKRGDPTKPGPVAEPGVLSFLMNGDLSQWYQLPPEGAKTSHRRAAMARWLTDDVNGAGMLAARVIVNRLWQHHFGRGIVATPSDFGAQGDKPTHSEIIEYLARELIHNGWSLKHIHRLILTSAAYQQSSQFDDNAAKVDPDNTRLWRFQPRRLEGESIRDSMLAVSDRLDATPFGKGTLDEKTTRRSIYFTVKRSKLIPSLVQWDWPEALTGVGRRSNTIVPTQALWVMNNPEVRKCAEALSTQLQSLTDEQVVDRAYQTCLGRSPTNSESNKGIEFLKNSGDRKRPDQLADFVQTLFMVPEFITIR